LIPLTNAWIEPADLEAVERAVQARAFGEGSVTRRFEKQLSDFLGTPGVVATNSCTSALILALRALGVERHDEVIVPTYTCLAVVNAVVQLGAEPVFADCRFDPEKMDFNSGAAEIKRKICARTKAIIVVHMFGVPAPIDHVRDLGKPVIEDFTLSFGARYCAKPLGAWGDFSVASFHESKMISCGHGGMVTAQTEEAVERLRFLNGWENEQVALRHEATPAALFELRYNFNMGDLAAALGLSQFARLDAFISRRRKIAGLYGETLSRIDGVVTPSRSETSNVFFRYMVGLADKKVVPVLKTFADQGIEVGRGVHPPLHRFFGEADDAYPNAVEAASTMISVPVYPALKDAEVEKIRTQLSQILG
jgi:perosamine synthetase